MSLTRRLALLLIAFLGIGGVLVTLMAFAYGKQAARTAYDRLLVGAAGQMLASVSVQQGRFVADLPLSAFELLAQAPNDRIFYSLRGPDGQIITGDDLPRVEGQGRRFFEGKDSGETLRYVVMERVFSERAATGRVSVTVGQTTRARRDLAMEITRKALTLAGFAGLLLIVLSILVARTALRPLREIERALRARSPQDLSPLQVPVPREISRLVAALDGFMARQDRNSRINRRLIADASHQIRTPIAALRVQAELAAEETDPDRLRQIASRIHARAQSLSGLTDQILSRAMIIHRLDSAPKTLIDLREVAIETAADTAEAMPDQRQNLRLDIAETPVPAFGDELSLREACKNLVINALLYGEAPVRIGAHCEAGRAILWVRDVGTGPSTPDRPKGSGLGLGIVRAICQAHEGEFDARTTPEGYLVRLELPRADTEETS